MDKNWELILQNKRLIYSVIYRYTKHDVDDIYQDAIILIYQCLCNKGDVDHDMFVSIVHGRVRDVLKKNARRNRNRDIPLYDYLIDFAYYGTTTNKKSRADGDTVVEASEGGDIYAA